MSYFSVKKQALYNLVYGSTSIETIWADQDFPQPDKTYIVLRMESFVPVGSDYQGRPDDDGDNRITGNREFTLNVQVLSANLFDDAFEALETLRMALNTNTYLDPLRVAGIAFVDSFPIQNLTGIQDTKFLPRGSMDLLFRTTRESQPGTGFIGIVKDMEGKYYKDDVLVKTEEITIDTIN